jgi:hypothetical protein
VVSRDFEVVLHGFDVISVVNDHVLDRIKVDGQGVLVVESDASHFTYGRIAPARKISYSWPFREVEDTVGR